MPYGDDIQKGRKDAHLWKQQTGDPNIRRALIDPHDFRTGRGSKNCRTSSMVLKETSGPHML